MTLIDTSPPVGTPSIMTFNRTTFFSTTDLGPTHLKMTPFTVTLPVTTYVTVLYMIKPISPYILR